MTAAFWQTWKEFEIRHGNEDTIREMLRIKRSIQATYNTQVNFMSSQMLKASSNATGTELSVRVTLALLRWTDSGQQCVGVSRTTGVSPPCSALEPTLF
ncbi:UNVERIFIED_CONTAM: hypothetical protein FKN15_029686 [Acipenser sinensis]